MDHCYVRYRTTASSHIEIIDQRHQSDTIERLNEEFHASSKLLDSLMRCPPKVHFPPALRISIWSICLSALTVAIQEKLFHFSESSDAMKKFLHKWMRRQRRYHVLLGTKSDITDVLERLTVTYRHMWWASTLDIFNVDKDEYLAK